MLFYYLEGRSIEDISSLLGIPTSEVRVVRQGALARLRQGLTKTS
jgi:DNA-directed RNA polymerase specialized sigma24 family protein